MPEKPLSLMATLRNRSALLRLPAPVGAAVLGLLAILLLQSANPAFSNPEVATEECKIDRLDIEFETRKPANGLDAISSLALKVVLEEIVTVPIGVGLKSGKYATAVSKKVVEAGTLATKNRYDEAVDKILSQADQWVSDSDDLRVRINGAQVVPADPYRTELGLPPSSISSSRGDRHVALSGSVLGKASVQIIEYDSSSPNDNLGFWEIEDDLTLLDEQGNPVQPTGIPNVDTANVYSPISDVEGEDSEDASIYGISYTLRPNEGVLEEIPERLLCGYSECWDAREPKPNGAGTVNRLTSPAIDCPPAYSKAYSPSIYEFYFGTEYGVFERNLSVCELRPDCGATFSDLSAIGGVGELYEDDIIVMRGQTADYIAEEATIGAGVDYIYTGRAGGQYLGYTRIGSIARVHVIDPNRKDAQWRVKLAGEPGDGRFYLQSVASEKYMSRCRGCGGIPGDTFRMVDSPDGFGVFTLVDAGNGSFRIKIANLDVRPIFYQDLAEERAGYGYLAKTNSAPSFWTVSVKEESLEDIVISADQSVDSANFYKQDVIINEGVTYTINGDFKLGRDQSLINNGTIVIKAGGNLSIGDFARLRNMGAIRLERAVYTTLDGTLTVDGVLVNEDGASIINYGRLKGTGELQNVGRLDNYSLIAVDSFTNSGFVHDLNSYGSIEPIIQNSGVVYTCSTCYTRSTGKIVVDPYFISVSNGCGSYAGKWVPEASTCRVNAGWIRPGTTWVVEDGATLDVSSRLIMEGYLISYGQVTGLENVEACGGSFTNNNAGLEYTDELAACAVSDERQECLKFEGASWNDLTNVCVANGYRVSEASDEESTLEWSLIIPDGVTYELYSLYPNPRFEYASESFSIVIQEGGKLVTEFVGTRGFDDEVGGNRSSSGNIVNYGAIEWGWSESCSAGNCGNSLPYIYMSEVSLTNHGTISTPISTEYSSINNRCGGSVSAYSPDFGDIIRQEVPCPGQDADGDGVDDLADAFPLDPYESADTDGDRVGDNEDDFPLDPTETADTDGDGIGNSIDTDDDNDTIPDILDTPENGRDPLIANWMISTASYTTCAIDDVGVSCWGLNDDGQADPTVSSIYDRPNYIPVLVAAGTFHTCAAYKSSRGFSDSVKCWGNSTYVEASPEYQDDSWMDDRINRNTRALVAGTYHSCSLDDAGVHCWGRNDKGQLNVPSLEDPTVLAAGGSHNCALDGNDVVCWGENGFGQAASVTGLVNPVALSASVFNTCVLDDNGVQCWGRNTDGQTDVPALVNPTAISTGFYHACAIDDSGVHCWGRDAATVYAPPTGLVNPTAITSGSNSCVRDENGVQCWGGDESSGQLDVADLSFDKDLDGVEDFADVFPLDPRESTDSDSDGVGDNEDDLPLDPTETMDTDRDGIGNNVDTDDDNDSIPDTLDTPENGRDPLVADWAVAAGGRHTCALDDDGLRCWGDTSASNEPDDLNKPLIVSVGYVHTCALDADGLSCWGENGDGQITVPVLSNPQAVSAGYFHTCALDDSGINCWGRNSDGQTTVPALSNPVAVSTGGYHTCALDNNGLNCWGKNQDGQITVPTLDNPRAVSAGGSHTCALDDTGVSCWGRGSEGQTTVPTLINPVAISAGGRHTCALDDNGVSCWGQNSSRQTAVPTLMRPFSVSAGESHTCALDDAGVHCWGSGSSDQIYVPTFPSSIVFDSDLDGAPNSEDAFPLDPTETLDTDNDGIGDNADTDDDGDGVDDDLDYFPLNASETLDTDFDDIGNNADTDDDGDGVDDGQDAFPLDASETVDTDRDGIGNNADMDDDNDTIPDILDTQENGRDPLVADWMVDAGNGHTCALDDEGVTCWGWNDMGQATVPALSNPVAVSAGLWHSCALDDSGVRCWGDNSYGQTMVPGDLSNPVAVSAGSLHTCALDDTGVRCWGDDTDGQTTVPGDLVNPVAISAGRSHSCAIVDDAVRCWGNDVYGQADVPPLTATELIDNPLVVAAGEFHTCALHAKAPFIACWGDDENGQTISPAMTSPWAIGAGEDHTCAVDNAGVRCWGLNDAGQSTVPNDLMNPVAVSAGFLHTCALDDSGVRCWGAEGEDIYDRTNVPVLAFDKDLDGLLDSAEDPNGNGIVDAGETDPLDADTDGDSFTDGEEVAAGSDPRDAGSTPVSAAPDGDLNDDGVVDLSDVLLGQRILFGEVPLTQEYIDRGDVAPILGGVPNPDGVFDLGDVSVIQRKVLGVLSF